MVFDRFATRLLIRVGVLLLALALLGYLVTATRLAAVALVVGVLAVVQVVAIVRFVGRTNRELTRFLGTIRYDDFSQSFSIGHLGSTFAELGAAFEEVLRKFRDARVAGEAERRYLDAVVEHVPIAILAVHDDGAVELLNNAARRLLNASSRLTLDALHGYGPAFQRDIAQSKPGERRLTRTVLDGLERHLIVSTTQVTIGGAAQRLICVQDIQTELDTNELLAWQDLVRVLSHEIMNSMTPISSLARTAGEMVNELPGELELVRDLKDAVGTLARRSDGLMRFVRSYRQLTHMPPPSLRPIPVREYFHRLHKLLAPAWASRGVALHLGEPAEGLVLLADEQLLDQALINVLSNAADAAAANPAPQVWLDGGISDRGRPVIEVGDNGPGFAEDVRDKIFLPFFTTKADGSGIGLALARQVMLIHRGAITASAREGGGALFRLTF